MRLQEQAIGNVVYDEHRFGVLRTCIIYAVDLSHLHQNTASLLLAMYRRSPPENFVGR